MRKGPGAGPGLVCQKNSEGAYVVEQSRRGGEREKGRAGHAEPHGWVPWRAVGRGGWDLSQFFMGAFWNEL